jgi:cyclic pyranopterin phosphate synthase
MPEEGIRYLPKKELLSYEEIDRLIRLLASMGISKVRLTGGEPFVRTDLMKLIRNIVEIPGIQDLHITSNGILLKPFVKELKNLGIASVNLSLDTLDRSRFRLITRRDEFNTVIQTFDELIRYEIPVKINCVVMEGKNIDDIIPLVGLTKDYPISVRFIEEMPFNGEGAHYTSLTWTFERIIQYIQSHFPSLVKQLDQKFSTSYNYHIPGHAGDVGVIAAFSRTFCGTCNRIRVTAQGVLKTCLYDDGVLNIRDLLRTSNDNEGIKEKLISAFNHRAKDGFEAEQKRRNHLPATESMSTIGG